MYSPESYAAQLSCSYCCTELLAVRAANGISDDAFKECKRAGDHHSRSAHPAAELSAVSIFHAFCAAQSKQLSDISIYDQAHPLKL